MGYKTLKTYEGFISFLKGKKRTLTDKDHTYVLQWFRNKYGKIMTGFSGENIVFISTISQDSNNPSKPFNEFVDRIVSIEVGFIPFKRSGIGYFNIGYNINNKFIVSYETGDHVPFSDDNLDMEDILLDTLEEACVKIDELSIPFRIFKVLNIKNNLSFKYFKEVNDMYSFIQGNSVSLFRLQELIEDENLTDVDDYSKLSKSLSDYGFEVVK